jgi:biotin-dependent carboxylase-like uncharacterized protein
MTTIQVISPGALTTIQDLGRPGWAHVGVPRSGAADRKALKLANHLVGNVLSAAALETTIAGPRLRFNGAATVALTGAVVDARVGDRAVPMNAAVEVGDGEILKVGNAKSGLRTYIAFAGGINVPLVLGSAATDTLTGLGPAALARGDSLSLARGHGSRASVVSPPLSLATVPTLHLVLGPRDDWFTADAITRLTSEPFTVTPASNRIGLRLDGPPLERARTDELLSEGLIPGAIQVPASGQPILLMADHPTTGGYPVIAVVVESDLPLAAQLRPGQQLRFTPVPARSQPRGASWGKRP